MRVPLQLLPKSSQPYSLAWLLAFALLAYTPLLAPCAKPQQRTEAGAIDPAAAAKTITIWEVGSPHRGDIPNTAIPAELASSAEELGYKLSIESFSAKDFTETFPDTFANHQEPDILVMDNYGIIDGITTPLGTFTGIGRNPKIRQNLLKVLESLKGLEGSKGGWEFLLQSSRNHAAARSLALRSPNCHAGWQTLPLTEELRTTAVRVGPAYVEGSASLAAFEDPDRLHIGNANQEAPKVSETKECGFWGNDHLAFVPLVLSYESPSEIGHATVLLTLRRQGSEWRLLTASRDPVTTTGFLRQIPKLSSLLTKPWTSGSAPIPAELDAPEDGQFPDPPSGQRSGDFTWQTSSSDGVVAEIVEFAYKNDARLFVKFPSGNDRTIGQISAGQLWTTRSPWKWRVWTIAENGSVSFSEARSFIN